MLTVSSSLFFREPGRLTPSHSPHWVRQLCRLPINPSIWALPLKTNSAIEHCSRCESTVSKICTLANGPSLTSYPSFLASLLTLLYNFTVRSPTNSCSISSGYLRTCFSPSGRIFLSVILAPWGSLGSSTLKTWDQAKMHFKAELNMLYFLSRGKAMLGMVGYRWRRYPCDSPATDSIKLADNAQCCCQMTASRHREYVTPKCGGSGV